MKNKIIGLTTVFILLLSGCAIKRDCDLKKEHLKCHKKGSESKNENKKLYLGE